MKTLKEFTQWLEEEQTPNSFSLETLKRIQSAKPSEKELNLVLSYLQKTLGKPSQKGSSRAVWILNETQVLKVGLLYEELDQNKREVKNLKCMGQDYAPKLYDFHPHFYWLLMEKVFPITNEVQFVEQFSKHVGLQLQPRMIINGIDSNIALVITNLIGGFQTKTYKDLLMKFNESSWFKTLISKMKKCRMDPGDLHYENWGIRPSTGELVLLDLGF